MAKNQSLRRRAYCKVYIGTRDVTSVIDPYLISVHVTDKITYGGDGGFDTCNIELDDRDGRLEIPAQNLYVTVHIGWAGSGPPDTYKLDTPPPPGSERQLGWEADAYVVFQGKITSVESGFARGGGGRRLWVEATSADMASHAKSVNLLSMGEGESVDSSGGTVLSAAGGSQAGVGIKGIPFSEFIQRAGQVAGVTKLFISPDIANTMRDFWYQSESFFSLLERLSKEMGFKVKIGPDSVMIQGKDALTQTQFQSMTIEAIWGVNLITWRIKPYLSRPEFDRAKSIWFDSVNSQFREEIQKITSNLPFGASQALAQLPAMAPNRQLSQQFNNYVEELSNMDRGTGWALINGEPRALANNILTINGARPGVNGNYLIKEAEHIYMRAGGYTTRCTLARPDTAPASWPTQSQTNYKSTDFTSGPWNKLPTNI